MAKTPGERTEELAEAIRKLTDTDERLVKVQEERLVEARKVEQQRASWDNLGAQLRESLLAPLKGLASAIPAPLRLLGKMAVAPVVRPFLSRKQKRLEAEAALASGGAPAVPLAGVASAVRGSVGGGILGIGKKKDAALGTSPGDPIWAKDRITHNYLKVIIKLLGGPSPAKAKELALEKKKGISLSALFPKAKGPGAGMGDWKKLLVGLATMGAAFGIAKALAFWQDVILPAGGFKAWWETSGWPTMKKWITDLGSNLINAIGGVFGVPEGDIQRWWDETGQPAISLWWEKHGAEITDKLATILVGIGSAALTQTLAAISAWWEKQDFGLPTLVKAIGGLMTLGILMKFAGKLAGVGGKPGPKGAARGLGRGLIARLGVAGLIAGWAAGLIMLSLASAGIIMDNIKQRHDAGETGLWAKINAILYGGDKAGGIANAMETAIGLAGPMAVVGFAFGGPAGAITGALIGLGVGGLTGYLGSDKFNKWGADVNSWVHEHLSPTVWNLLDAINGILKDAVKPVEALATAAAKALRAAIVVTPPGEVTDYQMSDFAYPPSLAGQSGLAPPLSGMDYNLDWDKQKVIPPSIAHLLDSLDQPWLGTDAYSGLEQDVFKVEKFASSPVPSTPTPWSLIPLDYGQDDLGQVNQKGMKGEYAQWAKELKRQYGDVKYKKGVTGEGLDIGIITRLQKVTSMFGKRGLTITSAFRNEKAQLAAMHAMLIADPKQYKDNYGNVTPEEKLASGWKSKHMSGNAVDIRYPPSVIGASEADKKAFVALLSKSLPNATAEAEGDHIHVKFDKAAAVSTAAMISSFQHWDTGGGQGRPSSDYKIEGLLRQTIPNYGALTPETQSSTGGGNVGFNSMAHVSTTNISQGKDRDVGYALAFIKTKNSRLGYAVG